MLNFLKSTNGRAAKAFTGALAATVIIAATSGVRTANAGAVSLDVINAGALFPSISYDTVQLNHANADKGSGLGAGFDMQLGAYVGDIADLDAALRDSFSGVTRFAAFKFWNPSEFEEYMGTDGNIYIAGTESGYDATIHDIYFETGLSSFLDTPDDNPVYTSNGILPNDQPLAPDEPPTMDPVWTGNYFGLNGNGSDGIGDGDSFEILLALSSTVDAGNGDAYIDTQYMIDLILGSDRVDARIAMHVGDCGYTSCVVDTWPPSVVPLPAALPLYGTGLAVMGLIGWRKRRKAAQA